MNKTLVMSVAAATITAFVAASAEAADSLVFGPPPEPAWSWTGLYTGLHVGGIEGKIENRGVGTLSFFDENGDPLGAAPISGDGFSLHPDGFMGGIQAGYNHQLGSVVIGIEGDFSFGDVGDADDGYIEEFGPARLKAELDWMATIRARAGWAWGGTLFYATGGMAFTEMKMKRDLPLGFPSSSDKKSITGWTVGGGVEQAVSDSIIIRAEYLYADFGRKTFHFDAIAFDAPDPEPGGPASFESDLGNRAKLTTHTFRVGVNWLF